jgi:hypothetical protein
LQERITISYSARWMFRGICVAVLSLTSSVSCWANELLFRKDSITVFGGVYTTVNMGETFNPFANHDSTYLVAGAYRREFIKLPWNIVLGGEVGLGLRFGTGSYGEIWAAPTARLVGIPLGNVASMSIGLVAGFSGITNPTDLERQREFEHSGNSKRCSISRRNSRSLSETCPILSWSSGCITGPACMGPWVGCAKGPTPKQLGCAGSIDSW